MMRTYLQETRWYDYCWEEYGPSCDQEQEVTFRKRMQALKLMGDVKRFQSIDGAFNGHYYDRMLKSLSQAFPRLEGFLWHCGISGEEKQIMDFVANRHTIRYFETPLRFDLGSYTSKNETCSSWLQEPRVPTLRLSQRQSKQPKFL